MPPNGGGDIGYSVRQIATALQAEAFGAVDLIVAQVSEPASAGPDDLAMAMDPKYGDGLASGQAQAAVLWQGADWQRLGLKAAITVARPRLAMAGVSALFDPGPDIAAGIHPSAIVDDSAAIGPGARIGPLVVIGAGVRLGANCRVASQCSIGAGTIIGDTAILHSGVRIQANVRIGQNFIAQAGAVIGSDGFSFVTPETSGVEAVRQTLGDQGETAAQSWLRIHSLGGVEIGDDVEIGANVTIDQGTLRATRIGNGTKLDNLVHLGHNVVVGEDCLLCGHVGIAGSSTIGNNVVLGGQVGVSDNISVGDRVIAGGGTKIMTNAPAGRVLLGYPAMKMQSHVESYKALRRLPRLFQDVKNLQKRVSKSDQNE